MQPLDRWALSQLNALIEKVARAYEAFDYHVVYHAIYNFCVVEMSNIYLDIIKDRLYCEEKDGLPRRSAQTAIFLILDALTRMLAPILAFTADEIWRSMPHRRGDDGENVLFNQLASPYAEYGLAQVQLAEWDKLMALRDGVNLELEKVRAAKLIGKPLEAAVTLYCDGDSYDWLSGQIGLLKTLFIVSKVEVKQGTGGVACEGVVGIGIETEKAPGGKCERCWVYSETVGENTRHPTLCARCAAILEK